MKSNAIAQTANIDRAQRELKKLITRPQTEVVGMLLIYGHTGYGKSRFVESFAAKNQYLYYRFLAEDKPLDFLKKLYQRLIFGKTGQLIEPKRNKQALESAIIDFLADNPKTVVIFDEINIPISERKWEIFRLIRDFADLSFASFILVGEHFVKCALEDYNRHFFDRIFGYVEFKQNTAEDFSAVAKEALNIGISTDLIAALNKKTNGNLRQFMKLLVRVELYAKAMNFTSVGLADFPKEELA